MSTPALTPAAEWLPKDFFRRATLTEIFPRLAPLEVDFGCGEGAFLLAMCRRHPERNFLGLERLLGRVRNVTDKIARDRLDNARTLRLESAYAVKQLLPLESIAVAHVLFPDPWPKRHHHNRRLIQDEFLRDLHATLAPAGELRLKTDDLPYFQWMQKAVARNAGYALADWNPKRMSC